MNLLVSVKPQHDSAIVDTHFLLNFLHNILLQVFPPENHYTPCRNIGKYRNYKEKKKQNTYNVTTVDIRHYILILTLSFNLNMLTNISWLLPVRDKDSLKNIAVRNYNYHNLTLHTVNIRNSPISCQ